MKAPKANSRRAIVILSLVFAGALAAVGFRGRPNAAQPSGPATEANITRLTAELLESSQFSHHPLDSELAGKFLDRYLDALDAARSLFLQSDVTEFSAYRTKLAQATHDSGNTDAAHIIFNRYLERLGQRTTYVTNLLRTGKFEFTGHDSYALDREGLARPRDIAAAQEVWRQQTRAEYLQEKLGDKAPEKIISVLVRRNEQQLRTMKALHGDEVVEIYLNALAHVYDPHSDYLGHEQMESLSIAMNLSLFGIGASLQTEDGYCKIHELLPGGPAARSGLFKPGDRIIAVAQGSKDPVDIVNMPLSRAVELIRGPKGTTVRLTIIPAGGADGAMTKTISLVRDEIKLADQEAKARIIDLPVGKGASVRLGVIDLPSFYAEMGGDKNRGAHRSATADVARLLTKLKAEKVRGIVMDMRRNGGGSLEESISLTGLFIRKGPVVQTRGPDGDIVVEADLDSTVLYDGPLVLLTSRFSASATEILTGALQDYGRAVVVGDSSTFGKGTVQNVLPLARVMDQKGLPYSYDPGALKITIRKFYRPAGASTQLRGVASNVILPSTSDFTDVSESALKDPLPWDSVKATPHDSLNRVEAYVPTLQRASSQRVAADRAFTYIAEDITRLRKTLATKTISLNEAERRQEQVQSKARHAERERESAKLLESDKTPTYDITLANAATPGLPPPTVFRKKDVKTDSKSRAPSTPSPDDDPDESPSGRSPADDAILRESVRILADYVDLLGRPAPVRPTGGAPAPIVAPPVPPANRAQRPSP